jgi:hypothetical protein
MTDHLRALTVALTAAALSFACAPAPRQRPVRMGPVDTGAGTLASARQYLMGRWTLLSYDVMPPGRPTIALTGQGSLNYDEFGNLDVEVRVDDKTAQILEQAGIIAEGGILSTKGRTAIDLQAKTLTYVLDGQAATGAPSGPLALNRPRHWEVDANVLTLTTRDDNGQALSIGRWQRDR